MAVTIATTTATLATGYGHQRSIDRCANGVLWAIFQTATGTAAMYYSTDNGATWVDGSFGVGGWSNGSMFIDVNDTLWLTWKQSGTSGGYTDGYIYAIYAEPSSTARTGWTNTQSLFVHDTAYHAPTIVAFADPASSGASIAAVAVRSNNGVQAGADVRLVRRSAAGTISLSSDLSALPLGTLNSYTWPVIDFHHTGDGKTVQGGTPHLYTIAASPDSGVVYRKHTYSAGTHTTGATVVLDSGTVNAGRLSGMFDGSRMCVVWSPSSAATTLKFAERDAADTTTTARTPTALSDGTILGVSATVDVAGDIWVAAIGDTSDDVSTSKLVRSTLTWGSWTATEAITATADSVQLRRCGVGQKIGVVYVQDTGTDAVRFHEAGTANSAPLAPSWVTAAGAADVAAALLLDWGFNDDQTVYGDTQSAYSVKRTMSATDRWWNGTDWSATSETYITSSDTSLSLASSWAAASDATRDYYVRTKDSAGLAGPYSDALNIVPSAKVNPSITSAATEDTATRTTTWTASEQTAYRARILLDGTTLLEDSGWVASSALRAHTFACTLTNLTTIVEEVTTRNLEGLASTADTNEFAVSYTPPFIPTVQVHADLPTGAITVAINNPTATGTRPEVTTQEVWRREDGETGDGVRVAVGVAEDDDWIDWQFEFGTNYEYRTRTFGDNGTAVYGVWVGITTTTPGESAYGSGAFGALTYGS